MPRAIAAIFALIIMVTAGIYGMQVTLEGAGDNYSVTNETWTSDPGNVTILDESNREGAYYADGTDVTVYNVTSSGDVEMVEGTDYEWIADNGTVKALSGGDLDPATDATISYSFQQTTEEQRELTSMIGLLPNAVALAIPAFALVLFLKFLT